MTSSQALIAQQFDLDEALTMVVAPDTEGNDPAAAAANVVPPAAWDTAALDDMPTVTSGDHACSICLEGFRQGNGRGGKRIPCNHVYHVACISSWLSKSQSCPVCRAVVPGKKITGI